VNYLHFGLSGPPFEGGSSPARLFMSRAHREALCALEWGVAQVTSGFSLLVGEVGTGKTTLVNAFLTRYPERAHATYVPDPRLKTEEIMSLMLDRLDVDGARAPGAELWHGIEKAIAGFKPGERAVVIVDDAQDLIDEGLEDLRMLSNIGADGRERLHFILVGQPELVTRLRAPASRRINQRIGARAIMNPLKFDQARAYVDFRLRQKGGTALKIFQPPALHYLITHSAGIPRRLNLLCNSAMLSAYAEGAAIVTVRCARAAVGEYENLRGS
jgi:general secretion pathway protein A